MVSDGSLAEQMREGCPDAFREVLRLHHRRMYGIAFGMTQNIQDAMDVVQEALLSAHRARLSINGETRVEAWLSAIVVNHARMLLRTRRRKPLLAVEDIEGQYDAEGHRDGWIRGWSLDPEDAAMRTQLRRQLSECAGRLPEMYQEVWVLADVEHMSMAEVAEVLGIGVPAVKTRLHRARLALREALCDARGER